MDTSTPLGVDPLIAEAKQRARRRRLALVLLLLLGAGVGIALYLSPPGSGGGGAGGSAANELPSSVAVPRVVGRGSIQSPPAAALAGQTLVAMSFPTVRTGYLLTGDGRLLRTRDEARTWREVGRLAVGRHLYEPPRLDFVTPSLGFDLAPTGRLLETSDGGARWRFVHRFAGGSFLGALDFVDADHGWATRPPDRIYRTIDGGRSWRLLAQPSCFGGLGGLSFVSSATGFADCGGEPGAGSQAKDLYETFDGGSTWQRIAASHVFGNAHGLPDIPTGGYAGPLLFRSPAEGMMAADRAGIYLTRNRGKAWSIPLVTDDAWSVSAMSWPSARVAYALLYGSAGSLLRSTDGGRHWLRIYPAGPGAPGGEVAAVTKRVVVGAGTDSYGGGPSQVVRTTDGGRTWVGSRLLPGGAAQLLAGAGSIWAVGTAQSDTSSPVELVYRSRDAGRTWTKVSTPRRIGIAWLDVATSGGSLFLSTLHGALYRSDDGGRSWQTVRKRGPMLGTVQMLSSEQGFALVGGGDGAYPTFERTADGGKTWQPVRTGSLSVRGVSVLDARHWWLWGWSGCEAVVLPAKGAGLLKKTGCNHALLLRTADAGLHWTATRMPSTLESYSFVTPRLGFAPSQGGILRTSDGGRTWRWFKSQGLPFADR